MLRKNIFEAAREGNAEIVQYWIDQKIDLNICQNRNSALYEAMLALSSTKDNIDNYFKTIELLILNKSQLFLDKAGIYIETRVTTRLCYRYPKLIPILTQAEISNPKQALGAFASEGQAEFVELLLKKGIDPNGYNNDSPPLYESISALNGLKDSNKEKPYLKIIELLVENGARFCDTDKNIAIVGMTIEELVSKYPCMIPILLKVDTPYPTNNMLRPFAIKGNFQFVKSLLDKKADPNIRNVVWGTTLYQVFSALLKLNLHSQDKSKDNFFTTISLLLENGAFLSSDSRELTIIQQTEEKHPELTKIFESHLTKKIDEFKAFPVELSKIIASYCFFPVKSENPTKKQLNPGQYEPRKPHK